jgi:CHASE2 domain-containing sensor protein
MQVDIAAFGDAERVIYRIAPVEHAGQKTQLSVSSAQALLAREERRLDTDGRIVLIGSTYAENGDFHRTPIANQMSGVYILANAIDTLATHGQFKPPPLWVSILVLFASTLLLHVVFAAFSYTIAKLTAMLLLTGLLFVLSVFIFSYGIGFSYALPLLVLQAIYMITVMVYERRRSR